MKRMLLRPRVNRSEPSKSGFTPIAQVDNDSVFVAILKWIPLEVVTVYKAVMGSIPEQAQSFRLAFTLLIVLAVPLWIGFATKPAKQRYAWRQIIIAPFAFVCWAIATQPDIVRQLYAAWESWMAFSVVAGGTLLFPILDGVLRRAGVTQN